MTKQELLDELERAAGQNGEGGHQNADWALIQYIDDREIEMAYTAVKKWYS